MTRTPPEWHRDYLERLDAELAALRIAPYPRKPVRTCPRAYVGTCLRRYMDTWVRGYVFTGRAVRLARTKWAWRRAVRPGPHRPGDW